MKNTNASTNMNGYALPHGGGTPTTTRPRLSKAFTSRLSQVTAGSAANSPTYLSSGRPAGKGAVGRQIVLAILKAFAIELQVPLSVIKKYKAARWTRLASRVTPGVLERVYCRLAHTLPHPASGNPANAGADLRYVAGFTDGDGCISTVVYQPKGRKRPGYRPRFQISCNDAGVLQDAQAILGADGKLYQMRRKITVRRQIWTLIYDGVHALHALCGIAPHLRVKGPQATAILAYWFLGRQWVNPGPKGTPPAILRARRFWHRRIAGMK